MGFHLCEFDKAIVGIAQPEVGAGGEAHRNKQRKPPQPEHYCRKRTIERYRDQQEACQMQADTDLHPFLQQGILLPVNHAPIGALGRFKPDDLPSRQRRCTGLLGVYRLAHPGTINRKTLSSGKRRTKQLRQEKTVEEQ